VTVSGLALFPLIASAIAIYRSNKSKFKLCCIWLAIAIASLFPAIAFGPYVAYWVSNGNN
jgi:hypothetical protein